MLDHKNFRRLTPFNTIDFETKLNESQAPALICRIACSIPFTLETPLKSKEILSNDI